MGSHKPRYRRSCLRRFVKLAAINLYQLAAIKAVVFCALASGVVFTLGAVAAGNAMRPPRLPVARVCPCLAHVQCESVAIAARDGVGLRGWYYTPEAPAEKAVILLHGIGSNRQDKVSLAT